MRIFVLSLADRRQPYGSTARPVALARQLARRGHDVMHAGIDVAASQERRLRTTSTGSLLALPHRKRLAALFALAKGFAPDLLYTHQRESGLTGFVLAPLLGIPHVYDAHTSLAWELPTYDHLSPRAKRWRLLTERLVLRRADGVVVPSVELRDWFGSQYRLRPQRLHLVTNGYDAERFRPRPVDEGLRDHWGIPADAPVIGFTNPRIESFPTNDMALEFFFQALSSITRRVPRARCLVFGGGREPPAPSEHLIYTGLVDDIAAHLDLCNLCVAPFPPQAVCGGTRTKVCEYLGCGKTVVSTSEGMRGFEDAIPGRHYLLADGAQAFADTVVEALGSPELRRRLGDSARRLARRYTWSSLAGAVSDVLESTVARAGEPKRGGRT